MLPMNGKLATYRRSGKAGSVTSTLLATADGLAVILTTYFATTWVNQGVFAQPYAIMLLLLLGSMGIFYDRLDVYRLQGGFLRHAMSLAQAWAMSFAVLLVLGFIAKQSDTYSRLAIGVIFVAGFGTQLLIHTVTRVALGSLRRPEHKAKALIVGTGRLSNHIYYRLKDNPWTQEHVEGAVTEGNEPAAPREGGPPVIGTLNDVVRLVDERGIRTVYLAIPLDASPLIESIYFSLLDRNVNVHWAPNIFSLNLINHSVSELGGIPILTLSESPLVGTNKVLKDLEDQILALLILLLVSPVMLITALAIKLEDNGPVFFRQPRTGWDGKLFHIWKFRSMRGHPLEAGRVVQATRDDPRFTRVGRIIRRTSIDELPQLFNVLRGEMSLVGPRPHAVQHNEEYAGKITAYLARHRIKPGITGLAQVRGFRGETTDVELMAKRVESDIEYINNWSLWLDLLILARTGLAVFRNNAY